MRVDAKLYVPFEEHFHIDVEYRTTQKYQANMMEKKLIKKYQSESLKNHNIIRGRSSADPLYWMLKKKSTSRLRKHPLFPIYYFLFFVIVGDAYYARYIYK